MIAIQTKKDVIFKTSKGKVRMEIDLIQNKPNEKVYELRIIDSVYKNVTENIQKGMDKNDQPILEERTSFKQVDKNEARFKTFKYEEFDALVSAMGVDTSVSVDAINDVFRQGLLFITQQECQAGITGEPGFGMYFTEAQDWEIVQE